jgi:hypothetical protein
MQKQICEGLIRNNATGIKLIYYNVAVLVWKAGGKQ